MIKFLLLILFSWPTLLIYNPIIKKTTKKWVDNESIPPRYSKETKKLLRKQKWAKFWAIFLGIIPFGPLSMIITWLSIRGKNGKGLTIKEGLAKQFDGVEDFKEEQRRRKKLFIKNMTSLVEMDKKIDWTALTLTLNLAEDKEFRDLVEYLSLSKKGRKKYWETKRKATELEEMNALSEQGDEIVGSDIEDSENSEEPEEFKLGESIPKLNRHKLTKEYGEDFVENLENSPGAPILDEDYPSWDNNIPNEEDTRNTEEGVIGDSINDLQNIQQDEVTKKEWFKKYSI